MWSVFFAFMLFACCSIFQLIAPTMLSSFKSELVECCSGDDVSRLEAYVASMLQSGLSLFSFLLLNALPGDVLQISSVSKSNYASGSWVKSTTSELRGTIWACCTCCGSRCSSACDATTFTRIPFQLISDVLERSTIAVAERMWSTVEELADDLTSPDLFSKGALFLVVSIIPTYTI